MQVGIDVGATKIESVVLEENGFVSGENWTTQKFPGAAHDEKSWAKRLHVPLIFAFGK